MGTAMEEVGKQIGNRAEEVATWYFRSNGFFMIPSYVIHKDYRAETPRTEADIIGVRFRHSAEYIGNRVMKDDPVILNASKVKGVMKNLFALVEVKSGLCAINGPWSNPSEKNINRALGRMGIFEKGQIESVSDALYSNYRWEDTQNVIQYFCIGNETDPALENRGSIIQITYRNIADFLYLRFLNFPEKIPTRLAVDLQWPRFGHDFAYWFDGRRSAISRDKTMCHKAVRSFIKTGSLYY
jgi:hypothetical protein